MLLASSDTVDFFQILKGQGPAAPLGETDFVVKGVMIGVSPWYLRRSNTGKAVTK